MTVRMEIEYSGSLPGGEEEIKDTCEAVVRETLSFEKFPFDVEVGILITGDDEIMLLNEEFRGIAGSTDVLSFPMAEFEEPGDYRELSAIDEYFDPDTGEFLLGDIVVSADHVKDQAASYGHSEKRELAFLIAHSMLHLIGYDHETDVSSLIMEAHEEEILGRLHITR